MGDLSPGTLPAVKPADERLDSWKEIAAYLKRDVTTVQRWEKREGMPVHRHLHDRMGSVYAFRAELDDWARSRNLRPTPDGGIGRTTAELEGTLPSPASAPSLNRSGLRLVLLLAGVGLALAIGAAFWL